MHSLQVATLRASKLVEDCTNARTEVFQRLLLDHNKLKSSFKQQQEILKNKDAAHTTALQKERDEVSRLPKELARVRGEKTEMEKALLQKEEHARKHKELLEATEVRATSAQEELDALKAKNGRWLSELTRLNHEMDEEFAHSQIAAVNTTRKARAKRAEAGPISDVWDIEDHLTALNARISPLKAIGTELLDAGIRVYRALWPESQPPASVAELSKCLLTDETRLREWRSSSARAGADQSLTFVLSWYEAIDLNALKSLRAHSQWTEDPVLIARRKEAASFMVGYAQIRHFVPGPAYSDDEEDASDYEDDEDDEEVESQAADTATDAAADTTRPATEATPVAETPEVAPSTEASPGAETAPPEPSSSTAAA